MRVRKVTHKYGIEILTRVENAKELDRQNDNTMWMDALAKEIYNIGVAVEVLDENNRLPMDGRKSLGFLSEM